MRLSGPRSLALAFSLLVLTLLVRPAPAEVPIPRHLGLPLPQSLVFCGEPVPLAREDVAERLDLEIMDTIGSPVRTALWFKRVPRYFPAIEAALKEKGLPQDLKYVAIIESNLRDDAVSEAGAVGPWQFMRETAAMVGLEKSEWRDGARDWVDSTRAALTHLELARYGAEGRGRYTNAP
ncbi:MAG: transglycosylase SLT domain-containing protein [Deltaproteobacteria bacterium]|nr:transglycosylase SLT domain-containing protein [Deltaproteobacteria bacterium]